VQQDQDAWFQGKISGPRLGFACRVSPSAQLVSRREEALLQVCVCVLPRASLTGCAIVAFRLFCHPICGVHDQRIPRRRRPWRSAGQEFSEMGGVGHPGAEMLWVIGAESPRPVLGRRVSRALGQKRSRTDLMIEV
jgi:hypothetical protein